VRTLLCLIVVVASTLVVGGCDPDAYPAAVPMASLVVARVLDGRGCHLPVLLTMTCEVSTAATGQCAFGGACLSVLGGAHVAATTDRSKSACVVAATARTKSKSWPSQLG